MITFQSHRAQRAGYMHVSSNSFVFLTTWCFKCGPCIFFDLPYCPTLHWGGIYRAGQRDWLGPGSHTVPSRLSHPLRCVPRVLTVLFGSMFIIPTGRSQPTDPQNCAFQGVKCNKQCCFQRSTVNLISTTSAGQSVKNRMYDF